ncbi:hypothetical protein [uncultured Paludibaculum sp.]|uniref:hypothetical protein n=1 Tax=uncultured Paludibaculum sp. TaxID=1765020 RepID=UPI002AABC6E3|nr:hypothetical protein [uncultured Paludibaculum sp.]
MHWICSTCGTQQEDTPQPPRRCPICDDSRQYVGWEGQHWTTLDGLRTRHRNAIREEEPGVWSIVTEPTFGIGQRAFLVRTSEGNILWDCISLLDDGTVRAVRDLGGIDVMAISHPHYYSSMIEWSEAFGGVPIWIHEAEREWVRRRSDAVRFWTGDTHGLPGGATLIRGGGTSTDTRRCTTQASFSPATSRRWPWTAAGRVSYTATRTWCRWEPRR